MGINSFEGVSVTTVILAPGACGGGLRGALPDAISVSPVVPVVPVALEVPEVAHNL